MALALDRFRPNWSVLRKFPSVPGPFDGTRTVFSIFVLLCYAISSIMHAEMAAIVVCVCVSRVLLTDGLSRDPGRICWSQGWSSHSSDHPSDCQSQSGSRRTCPPAEPTWSSGLHSSPRNSHWKTQKDISLEIWEIRRYVGFFFC